MCNLLLIFFAGLGISFLGSLPLGALNMTAMQIAVTENTRRACWFALGVALVEIAYVRLSLKGIDWIMGHKKWFTIMEWATVLVFLALGISSLLAARRGGKEGKHLLLRSGLPRFTLGLTMSAINPAQIPFWFIWSSYLFSIGWLQSSSACFNIYTIGIGVGTTVSLLLFVYGGRWLVNRLQASQRTLGIVVGWIFLISAGIQLYRVVGK